MALLLMMTADTIRPSSHLMAAEDAQEPASRALLKSAAATSPDIPFTEYDVPAEQQLLAMANGARAQAGAPKLVLDAGLTQAARAHAEAMFAARELSHQFAGEPTLMQRLAAATRLQLDQEGENVALDFDAAQGHEHLMLSPPHRANLMNAAYNVVGMAVIRSADRIYIVQDFGHALPTYSISEVEDKIAAAITQTRRQANQPELSRRESSSLDAAACSMAQADKLGTSPIQQLVQRYTVLTYTSLHPEALPDNAGPAIVSRNLHSFSTGVCYARTETYPTGVYWIVLALD
jgi:uncharacterized protein YkwD